MSDCVKIKLPAKLGGKPEKIDAIAALAMASVAIIQRDRVVTMGNSTPGGGKKISIRFSWIRPATMSESLLIFRS